MKLRAGRQAAGTALMAVAVLATATALAGCGGKTTDTKNKTTSTVELKKDDALAKMLPDRIRQKGEIVIAADASYAPNEFSNDGGKTFVGMDIDLGNAIGKVLGVKVKFVNANFDGILAGIEAGKYDLGMSSFTDRKDREQIVDMVTYFRAGTSIAVRKGNPLNITTAADLCGKRVSAERGTIQVDAITKEKDEDGNLTLLGQCLKDGKPAPVAVPQPDQNGVNGTLVANRADAFTADSPVVDYQVKVTNGDIEQGGETTDVAPYGIAVPKDKGDAPEYSKAIQGAVKKLIDGGHYKKILDTWNLQTGAITDPQVNPAGSGG